MRWAVHRKLFEVQTLRWEVTFDMFARMSLENIKLNIRDLYCPSGCCREMLLA